MVPIELGERPLFERVCIRSASLRGGKRYDLRSSSGLKALLPRAMMPSARRLDLFVHSR